MSKEKTDQSVWLVDNGKLCAGFCGRGWKWVTYTDPNALKFENAENAAIFIAKNNIKGAKAVEHAFIAPAADKAL